MIEKSEKIHIEDEFPISIPILKMNSSDLFIVERMINSNKNSRIIKMGSLNLLGENCAKINLDVIQSETENVFSVSGKMQSRSILH